MNLYESSLKLMGLKLSPRQYIILHACLNSTQRMTDLASLICTSTAAATGLVDYMERKGWVKRVDNPEDRRSVRIATTEAGRSKLNLNEV